VAAYKFNLNDRVALKFDSKYHGHISHIHDDGTGHHLLYQVMWDKSGGPYYYLDSYLITEAESNKLQEEKAKEATLAKAAALAKAETSLVGSSTESRETPSVGLTPIGSYDHLRGGNGG
jgi:hypothetical protein